MRPPCCAVKAVRVRLTHTCYSKTFAMASSLENLETQLELFIENVRQIHIIVSDFQPQSQNVLNQKLYVFETYSYNLILSFIFFVCIYRQSLVHGLQEVDKLKSQVQDVHVPLEVFEYVLF